VNENINIWEVNEGKCDNCEAESFKVFRGAIEKAMQMVGCIASGC
jgi:hypothetical protein